jgi:hypothetical protein
MVLLLMICVDEMGSPRLWRPWSWCEGEDWVVSLNSWWVKKDGGAAGIAPSHLLPAYLSDFGYIDVRIGEIARDS